MTVCTTPAPLDSRLHWTQRIALTRHALHAASTTSDFTFFKFLQAHFLLSSTDHIAALHRALGPDAADSVLASLDNFNSVIAYVHEDAYKNLYEAVKAVVREPAAVAVEDSCSSPTATEMMPPPPPPPPPSRGGARTRAMSTASIASTTTTTAEDRRAMAYVDALAQREKASAAIDKMTNSALTIIHSQPPGAAQDAAATVFIVGLAFVADAVQVVLHAMAALVDAPGDFIRLEGRWAAVQTSVGEAVTVLKGVFGLMGNEQAAGSLGAPTAAAAADASTRRPPRRDEQVESTIRGMLRRMSSALASVNGSSAAPSRRGSVSSLASGFACAGASPTSTGSNGAQGAGFFGNFGTANGSGSRRSSTAAAPGPNRLSSGSFDMMPTIPPTPADALVNPFESSFAR